MSKKESGKMISLSGKSMTADGKIEKTQFFDCLKIDLDKYDDVVYTEEEAVSIRMHMMKLQTGATAMVPLYCAGERCPINSGCPLYRVGKYPTGRSCPVEGALLNTYIVQYMEEYKVDPNNLTERGYVQELATIDIYLHRINLQLAKPENALMLVDQAVGADREGNPIYRQEVSPLADQREKLLNRRSRVIKLMVGDPQEKYKKQAALKTKSDDDLSTAQTDISRKVRDLQRQLDDKFGNTTRSNEGNKVLSPQDILDKDEEY